MSIECIKDANLEETGFKVVRFNELKIMVQESLQ